MELIYVNRYSLLTVHDVTVLQWLSLLDRGQASDTSDFLYLIFFRVFTLSSKSCSSIFKCKPKCTFFS